ncbi:MULTISPECIES: hypothetical protein [Pasteurellaceae]|uniref:Uncharacterized protein n=3 Tax=Pasteurellaceae TaxID=712 RepID=A0AAQ4LS66_9PAST|nr:hypothetical protein [Pasteurella atlantica]MBR0573786.1 hypothetical protein [Pasteurella atlantica]MDP8039722.1 hypothetical protein [Pasteurella atlantica]MDP8041907.1 hypothetical protein [Pasteurella atlantica]MDP8044068.1 hypothetical protein [Pasteurella atlantica]MDP8046046.1 hypothetical protein [Pasteurella atlantica]
MTNEILDLHQNVAEQKHKISPMNVIDNPNPKMDTEVEHILYLPELCPASKNPKQGSFITLRYKNSNHFLELFSLDKHIDSYIGHTIVRDMEYFVQTIAQAAADVLKETVTASAKIDYNLIRQCQKIYVVAKPSI